MTQINSTLFCHLAQNYSVGEIGTQNKRIYHQVMNVVESLVPSLSLPIYNQSYET